MKFWQKIFVYSVLLFLIIFNFGAFSLIQNSYNLSLKREIRRSLAEHRNLLTGITYNINLTYKYLDTNSSKNQKQFIFNYLKKINTPDMYLEVLDANNNKIFSNLDFNVSTQRSELQNAAWDERKYIIRDIGDRTYLFVTSLLDVKNEYFKFSYIRDITYIYEDKKEEYNIFFKISGMVSVILAVGMYFLSKYITNPINKLIIATRRISNGNYSERAEVNSKDEIGILADNFNEMASAVEEKINELEKKTQDKQIFINNLTHELKTPLTSIIGYSDFLRSIPYNEKVFTEGLNNIFTEGKRIETMSWKMMDLVLLKKQNFKMSKQNINNILLDLNDYLKPKLKSKKINLIVSSGDYEVTVEKDLIINLFGNLVDNAIKASKEGSNIYINAYKNKENKVEVEVKDEGMGIPKEHLSKIFDAFYMVDKARTRANNEAGLGLSICAEIVKIHDAQLKIKSEVNKGTSIKIIFN